MAEVERGGAADVETSRVGAAAAPVREQRMIGGRKRDAVLRDRLGKPLIVRSAYRSPQHNRAVGGAKRSKHMDSCAFDIAMARDCHVDGVASGS